MADGSDLLAKRKAELERRLAALDPAQRASAETSWTDGGDRIAAAGTSPVIPRRVSGATAPMSFAQELLWLLERTNPGHAYNVPRSVRLRGVLDIGALQRALDAVVVRHEALRTTFGTIDGQPSQIIHAPATVPWTVIDLGDVPDADREVAARNSVRELASIPFDLEHDRPLRATIIRLADDDHVVVLVSHHIVSDGWSGGVILRELGTLYQGLITGIAVPLPDPAVQYADYAAWQRTSLAGTHLDDLVGYWRGRLAGAAPLLELPADHPRPATPNFAGAWQTTLLPPAILEAVRTLAQAAGTTPFTVFLTALYALLYRYSAEEELVVGTPVAGRLHPELDGVVGYFANTLLLRASLSGTLTGRQLLNQVRNEWLAAYDHQEIPFEKLLLERGADGTPIATVPQVVLMTDDPDRQPFQLHGTTSIPFGSARGATKFDLTFRVSERADGIGLGVEYRADLFDAPTVERMLGHFGALLEAMVSTPDTPIADLPIMSPAEQRRLLGEWSGHATEYSRNSTVGELFAEQAAATPDAIAVVAGDRRASYGELRRQADAIAASLRTTGVDAGRFVAIAADRSIEMLAAMLAVLDVGAVYVPLDPQYPVERLAFMLRDTAAPVVLVQAALVGVLKPVVASLDVSRDGASAPRLLVLEDLLAASTAAAVTAPARKLVTAESPAYVMYTSGSTGQPKGVVVPHRAIVRLVRGADYADLGPAQVMLAAAPASFDASTLEIWGALLNGGRLVLAPPGPTDPRELGDLISRHHVTTLWLTSALFQQVVDADITVLRGVRQLLAGGDVLPVSQVRRVLAELPDCRVINGYGPTENTTFTCCYTVPRDWPVDAAIPIGRPIANTTVYVLDPQMRPVPIGVPGELYAGGDGVALGYHARPELTAERFVADPFSVRPGARLYRTGDRVRWRVDGTIEFLGRFDTQVKIRGFRIELGEVEAALLGLEGVASAVAIVREDMPGDKQIAAYIVATPEAELSVATLRDGLRLVLPAVMLPATITVLDRLPITANGKLDRRALPAPAGADRATTTYVPPDSRIERELAEIWSRVLGTERVGIHDDFFALGGHSLLAMRVIARVADTHAIRLPLRALFEAPTIAALAARIESVSGGEGPASAIPRRGLDTAPLSPSQALLWRLQAASPALIAYNVPILRRITGPLDPDALQIAVDGLTRRQELLRSTFELRDGEPTQVVHRDRRVIIDRESADSDAAALALTRERARQPFDLRRDLPIRVSLIRVRDDGHYLLIVAHHIAVDAWSVGIIARELAAHYDAAIAGTPAQLPSLPIQFADVAAWQHERAGSAALARQLEYWRDQLRGAPSRVDLPVDPSRPGEAANRSAKVVRTLPRELLGAVERMARDSGASAFHLLMAGFAALLHRYSRQDDIVIGSVILGRDRRESEHLVGYLSNTLPIRVVVDPGASFRGLVGQVRETSLAAAEHADVPYEQLVEEAGPAGGATDGSLFNTMLVLQPRGPAGFLLGSARMVGVATDLGTAKFDLLLSLHEEERGLRASAEYRADLFEPATVDRMLSHFEVLLRAALDAPDTAVATLPLLLPGERDTLMLASAGDDAEFPAALPTAHAWFAAQVERTPEGVAALFEGDSVTYRELDLRANRLAHRLQALGIGPDVVVGIAIERSINMLVAVLAALKAGGAYAPIDPEYPADRIASMLATADVPVVLTSRSVAARLPSTSATLVVLDDPVPANVPTQAPPSTVTADHLAYVIFTSGSTGQPKGVAMPHRPLVNLLQWQLTQSTAGPGDRTLQFASLSFDVSFQEIFSTWASGGTLVLVGESTRRDPAALLRLLERERVARVFMPYIALQHLADSATASGAAPAALREVITAGEQLQVTPGIVAFMAAIPGAVLFNQYGPSETHVVTQLRLDGAPAAWPAIPSIGRPIANVRAYILDAERRLAPAGVPGELFLGGVGIARGYLGRSDLTDERFLADPFAVAPGGKIYRTGDIARWRADGEIEFLGRADHQVKIRGFRVEPGEIEAVLATHPQVSAAVVVARTGAGELKRLIAYVVPAGSSASDFGGELREWLRERLPEYMVPAVVLPLDALPTTPSGKIDRKALPEPSAAATAREHVEPATATEIAVAATFAAVLRREQVGATDDFYDLGGHSLLAIRISGRLQEELGVAVPMQLVFEHPVVRALAAAIDRDAARVAAPARIGVTSRAAYRRPAPAGEA